MKLSSSIRRCSLWLISFAIPFTAIGRANNGWNASARTGTRITPDYFQFAEIIPERERGGWRAVCIMASVGQRIANPQGVHIDSEGVCPIEVGVPISNEKRGYIPLEEAQHISANVANDVAYSVLQKTTGPFAVLCTRITKQMNDVLEVAIEGAKVKRCGSTRSRKLIPVVHWP